jgi:hypothetical protein
MAGPYSQGEIESFTQRVLKITSEGRKAVLDMRLVKPKLGELPFNKIDALVERVGRIYHRSSANKGAQLIFGVLAVPKGRGTDTKGKNECELNDVLEVNVA